MNETDLCTQFRPWITSLAARYARSAARIDLFEDLVQAGFVGLIIAARQWRADGGASIATYAEPRIREEMRRLLDSIGWVARRQRRRRGEAPIASADPDLIDRLATPATQEDSAHVESILRPLSDRSREVVIRSILGGQTYREIADGMGLSKSRIDQVLKDALEIIGSRAA